MARIQVAGGAVPSPFDCWLVLRGIATLPCRVRAHSRERDEGRRFLERPSRRWKPCTIPGSPATPATPWPRKQMAAFGGMLSVQVQGDAARALAVAARLRVFTRATSFGGTESLVEHRASIEGPGTRTPENLLRLSIGPRAPGRSHRGLRPGTRLRGRRCSWVMLPGATNGRRTVLAWTLYDFANSAFSAIVVATIFPVYYAEWWWAIARG